MSAVLSSPPATLARTAAASTTDWGLLLLRLALGTMWIAHALLKPLVFTFAGTAQFFESVGIPGALVTPVFAASYLLWLYQRTSFGTPKEEFVDDPHIHDVQAPEWIAWTPLVILIVVLGVFPNLIFEVTDDTIVNVAEHIVMASSKSKWMRPPLNASSGSSTRSSLFASMSFSATMMSLPRATVLFGP